jgi:hypothetical protein
MAASIPASAIVSITPNVIGAGGSGLDLVGLILTDSTRPPIGTVQRFASAVDVATYFGPASVEAGLATTYFNGYVNSDIKPALLLFSQYNPAAAAGYLRGANPGLTLTALQALTGTLTYSAAGSPLTSSTITLSGATSFSNAATIIQAAFTSPTFTVTYDSVSGAFVFTNTATGASSTASFATGSLAATLKLTAATGAVTSQGALAAVPGTAMDAVVAQTQDFVSFMTTFEPSASDAVLFATWNNGKLNRYLYVSWDTDATPTTSSDTASVGYLITQAGLSGTMMIYEPTDGANKAAFVMGSIASINYNAFNRRVNMAFRSGSALTAGVTNQTIASNLNANGYNFYGAYATANAQFQFLYNGQVSGPFKWVDSYINQIQLNNALQLALMNLLVSFPSIPYNNDGYSLIETAMLDPVLAALTFGTIRAGVTLSNAQAAAVNALVGKTISDIITQRGWYISIADPGAAARALRTSPVVYLFYCDGGSVQRIQVTSDMIQ